MKVYYLVAASMFFIAYGIFHFGFRKSGAEQLYRINDRLAFKIRPETEYFNGITLHGFKRTSKIICFVCGEYEPDDSRAAMMNVKYRRADFVYTDFPAHEQAKTDIVNLRTGETIEAQIPSDFKYGDDFSRLAEYDSRGLIESDEFRLTPDYVKANFQPLSTFTNRCLYAHLIFAGAALLLAFPKLFIRVTEIFVQANDPTRPENYY